MPGLKGQPGEATGRVTGESFRAVGGPLGEGRRSRYNAGVDSPDPGALSPRAVRLLAEADLCVKCGLCLPRCPTYALSREEGESPRGRIALGQGLASGALPVTARLAEHLGSCLSCRACEAACPAGVPYGRIIEAARGILAEQRPPGMAARWALRVAARAPVDRPAWWRAAMAALRAYSLSTVRPSFERVLERVWPRLARLARYVPRLEPGPAWKPYYPPVGESRGEVALFLGCVAREVDRPTLEASVRVLNRLGLGVHVPAGQGCCGAMHLHGGDEREALRLAKRNLRAFSGTAGPVVVAASGCAAALLEYGRLAQGEAEVVDEAREFTRRVAEVTDLMTRLEWPAEVTVAPLPLRVAVHEPCSLRNVLRRAEAPYRLLARIPGLEALPLPGNDRCCGAAGTHMVTRPEAADSLRGEKLDALGRVSADVVVTANVGCALHLAAGVTGRGGPTEVLHPVVLLDRQLR